MEIINTDTSNYFIIGTLITIFNIVIILLLVFFVIKFFVKAMKCMDKYLKE
jgi:hypothetical protein